MLRLTKSALRRDQVEKIKNYCENTRLLVLMAIFGSPNMTKFRDQVLNPLLDAGLVEMIIPEKSLGSKQKYRFDGYRTAASR